MRPRLALLVLLAFGLGVLGEPLASPKYARNKEAPNEAQKTARKEKDDDATEVMEAEGTTFTFVSPGKGMREALEKLGMSDEVIEEVVAAVDEAHGRRAQEDVSNEASKARHFRDLLADFAATLSKMGAGAGGGFSGVGGSASAAGLFEGGRGVQALEVVPLGPPGQPLVTGPHHGASGVVTLSPRRPAAVTGWFWLWRHAPDLKYNGGLLALHDQTVALVATRKRPPPGHKVCFCLWRWR